MTAGRSHDKGNATLRTLTSDFKRVGMPALGAELATGNARWTTGDKLDFEHLTRLRNALAHGNASDLDRLHAAGVRDTVTWARARLAVLNRMARAMDRATWDHLRQTTGQDPWRRVR